MCYDFFSDYKFALNMVKGEKMMKKLKVFLALLLVAALLAACGGEPAATEPPTQEITEAPTDPPTDPPTEPPTDPPTEPLEPITGYHITEPEGFVAAASTEILSILAGPDGEGTSITIMKLDVPMELSELTEENFTESLGINSEEQEITLHSMENVEVDGYPGVKMEYDMTASGITALYRAYFVTDYKTTYVFIFADATADGAWADAFAASADSINMLLEGEVLPVDTTGLEHYDLGCGLTMYAAPGLEKFEDEELAAYLEDANTAVMVYEYNKSEFGLYGISVEDFVSMLVDGEVITGFAQDPYGNVAAAYYDYGADGNQYFYYTVGKNTADSFWLIDCACNAELASVYVEAFAQWCATVAEAE